MYSTIKLANENAREIALSDTGVEMIETTKEMTKNIIIIAYSSHL